MYQHTSSNMSRTSTYLVPDNKALNTLPNKNPHVIKRKSKLQSIHHPNNHINTTKKVGLHYDQSLNLVVPPTKARGQDRKKIKKQ
ncbi:hypothetical protein KC19_2G159600 [Ceratodon purpureus]|uniref:Uncharacterized protein n=1 Tax=Ceratodon purpureus TaxID=3225 RepID=A0A8T0IXB5_CERPU|nr:hypothetical protein KC19_2G159600 [Ceratodon purpureus]